MAAADTGTTTPLKASFTGTFTLGLEATGPTLRFSGLGTGTKTGLTTITGVATLGETDATGCTPLLQDAVTLTAADGSQLFLTNDAIDCVSGNAISGTGTYSVTGGTGRFEDASGSGSVSTAALITGGLPDGTAIGTFDPLSFDGVITL
jgi:hypothetical protein